MNPKTRRINVSKKSNEKYVLKSIFSMTDRFLGIIEKAVDQEHEINSALAEARAEELMAHREAMAQQGTTCWKAALEAAPGIIAAAGDAVATCAGAVGAAKMEATETVVKTAMKEAMKEAQAEHSARRTTVNEDFIPADAS